MNGRRVILNPGEDEIVLEESGLGYSEGVLWLYLTGLGLAEAFSILNNQANTAVIVFQYGEMSDRFEGYTRLTCVMESDGMVSASLKKEARDGV